jgi:tetratricopeptide (TPR) repeat protein
MRLRGLDRAADQELQALIQESPAYEPAYQQLINSLFRRMARGDAAANLNAIVSTLNKLASAVPDSQFGRIMSALIYARAGRGNDAEGVLKGVLAAEPDNADALVLLAQLWQREGRGDQSATLLETALRRKSQTDVVRALAGTYRDTDRKGDALALARRHMEANADAEAYVLLYAGELVAQEQQSVAAGVLADAIKRFPRSQPLAVMLARLQEDMGDHDAAIQTVRSFMQAAGQTSDRYYLLSNFYSLAGNHDAAVAALQQVLAIMPDHVGANNDLGYFWANAGIRIDQAEPMIRKALENKPDDPAFIDSLGWLYYKQGKFAEARTQLERALSLPGGSSPEVVRHLADTLYRLGLSAQAIERWAQAEQLLGRQEKLTASDRKEKQYLSETLAAARSGREPLVSPLAEPPGAKAAVPANTPATLPR